MILGYKYADRQSIERAATQAAINLTLESGILVVADSPSHSCPPDCFEIVFYIGDKRFDNLREVRSALKMKAFL